MNKRIRITQQHVDNGRKGYTRGCAIALALKQESIFASVSGWIHVDGKYYQAQDEVLDWIRNFDSKKPVKPFTIELIETHVLDKFRPQFVVHTSDRLGFHKAQKMPTPPEIKMCGIARIAD